MTGRPVRVAVLTSGGDAQAMNAAVRAVVRTALHAGAEVFAVHEGYDGLAADDPNGIARIGWDDVSRILDLGGTVLGTARSETFRTRDGRRRAAGCLVRNGIDRLVVIGGDGSLTGAMLLHEQWPALLDEAVRHGELTAVQADEHRELVVLGVPGSIDNDLTGTDTAIGTDSALGQIVDAIDAIEATATSHRRTFVVEVMGRNCGYLAAAGAIAGGADYVLVPENPPGPDWQDELCELLGTGRSAGRRNSVVVVAEGAREQDGTPITSDGVRALIQSRLGHDTRVSVPGHVQRGGTPSAADRVTASLLGYAAALAAVNSDGRHTARFVGIHGTRTVLSPLHETLERARQISSSAQSGDDTTVRALRGAAFGELLTTSGELVRAMPRAESGTGLRVALMVIGDLAPGMNAIARVLVRLGLPAGLRLLQVDGGPKGLIEGRVRELDWKAVCGWAPQAGSHIIAGRGEVPDRAAFAEAARAHQVDAFVLIGGWDAYETASRLDGFGLPVAVIPAGIAADVPGSEASVGADSALNWVVANADRIRHLGTAEVRCIVLETAGGASGYLPTLAGLAGGAVRVYAPERLTTVVDIRADAERLARSVEAGQRLGLVMRGDQAAAEFSTDVLCRLFDEFGGGRYAMHQVVLGQTQFGGSPTAADRVLAARMASCAVGWLADAPEDGVVLAAVQDGLVRMRKLSDVDRLADHGKRRPREPWWQSLELIGEALSNRPGTSPRLISEFAPSAVAPVA